MGEGVTYTAREMQDIINAWHDKPWQSGDDDFGDWYYNASQKGFMDTVVLGDLTLEIVEAEVGIGNGQLLDNDVPGGVWKNWLVFKVDDQYFRLWGEADSWDGQGWDRRVEEVESVKKTIEVWEKKNDY